MDGKSPYNFEYNDQEETYCSLVDWLKKRRDEWNGPNYRGREWAAIDQLIDEARDAGVEGFLPWQR